jgi:hypothetical protein
MGAPGPRRLIDDRPVRPSFGGLLPRALGGAAARVLGERSVLSRPLQVEPEIPRLRVVKCFGPIVVKRIPVNVATPR